MEEAYPAKIELPEKTPSGDIDAAGVFFDFNDVDKTTGDFTAAPKPFNHGGKGAWHAESLTTRLRMEDRLKSSASGRFCKIPAEAPPGRYGLSF